MNETDLLIIGSTLCNGRYKIVRHIASGGFGNTYEAFDTLLENSCAIKEFFMKSVTHRNNESKSVTVSNPVNNKLFDSCKAKFKKEAKRLASFHNAHIVRVSDLFEENNTIYYVMDYIDGCSLAEKMKRQQRPFSESECKDILLQLLSALEAVHAQGLLHMDIKPGNIMIDNTGKCTLIDFGACKILDNDGISTTSTATAFTVGYAPPELQSGNNDKWGEWTDIYSVGATLYDLLTDRRPPLTDELIDGKDVFSPLKNISLEFVSLIKKMLLIRTTDRPQNVDEIKRLLHYKSTMLPEESMGEVTIVGGVEDTKYGCVESNRGMNDNLFTPNSPVKGIKKNWPLLLVVTLILLAAIVGFIVFYYGGGCEESNRDIPVENNDCSEQLIEDNVSMPVEDIDNTEKSIEDNDNVTSNENKEQTTRHMDYYGVPFDRELNLFVSKMEKEGFSTVEKDLDMGYWVIENKKEDIKTYIRFDVQNHNTILGVEEICLNLKYDESGMIVFNGLLSSYGGKESRFDESSDCIDLGYGVILVKESYEGYVVKQIVDSINTKGYELWNY